MEHLPHNISNAIEALPEKFSKKDYVKDTQRRVRKFNPKSLLLTMVRLVSTTNKEGYDHALVKVFNFNKAPSKSALSQFRQKINFSFFQSIFEGVMANFENNQAEFKGMRIYAVDGWQITLPRTDSIVSSGFTGRKTSKYRESYMPKGYVSHIYDVLSETTKDTFVNHSNTELVDALGFIDKMENNSISIYDRAYFSRILCKTHFEKGSYFLARCQSNANAVVKKLFDNKGSLNASMYIETTEGKKKIWFIKVINKKKKTPTIFATNLPQEWRTRTMLDSLYQLRWGVETSFYELSETAKIQQWHSSRILHPVVDN